MSLISNVTSVSIAMVTQLVTTTGIGMPKEEFKGIYVILVIIGVACFLVFGGWCYFKFNKNR